MSLLTQRQIGVCLDKFRGTATASDACRRLARGIRDTAAGHPVVERPVADGGEGTVDALVEAGYRPVTVQALGPSGHPVFANLAARGGRAVVEPAPASGLSLLREVGRAIALGLGSFRPAVPLPQCP